MQVAGSNYRLKFPATHVAANMIFGGLVKFILQITRRVNKSNALVHMRLADIRILHHYGRIFIVKVDSVIAYFACLS